MSAAQVAVSEHVPEPLIIVTVLPRTEQAPLAVMAAAALALVVAETLNVELYGALTGAPVKVMVGLDLALAVIDWDAAAAV